MKFFLVSRGRYEDALKQLEKSEAERARLLEALLDLDEAPATQPAESVNQAFTTPIDRVLARFDKAKARGIPARFKARMR